MYRFYGLHPDDALNMELDLFYTLWQSITVIEAQEILMQLKISDWPNMKDNDRQKFHRDLHRAAYPKTKESVTLTMEQFAAALGRL